MVAEDLPGPAEAAAGLADSKRQIVGLLKRTDNASVAELAAALSVTTTAVRQHLDALEVSGLVRRVQAVATGGRGRPAARWTLTPLAAELFPDRHRDLTVELIAAIRAAVGEEGLERVISERTERQRRSYEEALEGSADLRERVERLASRRAAEGYLAEVQARPDGSFDLIEHHCPICEAAAECTQLCRDELEVFDDLLGDDANVERTSHLFGGAGRCSYRITPVDVSIS